jgi:hypothetical protein
MSVECDCGKDELVDKSFVYDVDYPWYSNMRAVFGDVEDMIHVRKKILGGDKSETDFCRRSCGERLQPATAQGTLNRPQHFHIPSKSKNKQFLTEYSTFAW